MRRVRRAIDSKPNRRSEFENPDVDRLDNSEEEEPNVEPTTAKNIKEMLWSALSAISFCKINFGQTNFNFDPLTGTINERNTIETLLVNISPKSWPP